VPPLVVLTRSTPSAANSGFTYVPWMLSVNFHGFYEYAARGRFQGQSFGLNIAKMF